MVLIKIILMQTRLQKRIQLEKEREQELSPEDQQLEKEREQQLEKERKQQLVIKNLSEKDKQLLKDNPPNGLTDKIQVWLSHVKSVLCPYQ